MTVRIITGQRYAGAGIWGNFISKPGNDAQYASSGYMLLDTSLQVFQSVMKGVTQVLETRADTAYAAGNNFVDVGLLPQLAPYSNLYMYATLYSYNNSGFFTSDIRSFTGGDDFTFNVFAGILRFNYIRGTAKTASAGTNITTHYAAWNIFRGQL